jgi:hypothetical protein
MMEPSAEQSALYDDAMKASLPLLDKADMLNASANVGGPRKPSAPQIYGFTA